MIRVLIAEDEPPVQRRTKRLIEHIDPDFFVAATVSDGEEALEKMQTEHIDVLFTDIRMPFVDGMKLMKAVQEKYPDCSIVVLSGYQDFEYVSNAVRAQAVDYLLKPVQEETMEKILFKLKERFLALKQGRLQQSVATRINRMFSARAAMPEQGVCLGICLFSCGAIPLSGDSDFFHQTSALWEKVSLVAMAKQLCRGSLTFVQEYMSDTAAERILVYQEQSGVHSRWTQLLHQHLKEQSKTSVNCACLQDFVPVTEIGLAHRQLRRLLAEQIIIGKSIFRCISSDLLPEKTAATNDFSADSTLAMRFSDILISGEPERNAAFRGTLFEQIKREAWTQRRVLVFFQRVMTMLEAKSPDKDNLLRYREWFQNAVSVAVSLSELEEITKSLETSQAVIKEGNATVVKVEEYLRGHFTEHITGQTLARKFGYVPSYISFLFRQEFGQSPADYLTKIRLDEAKSLLRKYPSMLVREVSEKVGFKNQYHFSRVFKKNEGLWPSDYKL